MTATPAAPLAILGAAPAFPEPLHVGRPNVGDEARLLARIRGACEARWLTNDGPLVREFETRVAALAGVRHCIATSNGTAALELALRALRMTGEVIVPSFTFVATPGAVQWIGGTPVFCDVDAATHCLDPRRVEALITPRTSGILGVHVWGNPCAVDELTDIARRHRLPLLFDAAHAFGSEWRGRPLGQFGDAEVYSFHATKFVQSAEGGAVVTNSDALAAELRLTRNFGFAGLDRVAALGMNAKMSEINAAMGLTSLDALDEFLAVNERNYAAYQRALTGLPGLTLLPYPPGERHNRQYIVVLVDEAACGLSRDLLVEALRAENVLARRYFFPGCHRFPPFAPPGGGIAADLPVTESLIRTVLQLPTGTGASTADIQRVGEILRTAIQYAPQIRQRCGAGT
jgi:dTDP-4-amino-4,6-dideoxygalactose transaminase